MKRFGDREFLRSRIDGQWRSLTYNQVAERVKDLTLGLYSLGVKPEDRIALWSENRPEWNIADLAILALGAADVPIYTTQARNQIEYILKDSASRAIFVSGTLLAAAVEIQRAVPSVELIVSFDAVSAAYRDDPVMTLDQVAAKGKAGGERPASDPGGTRAYLGGGRDTAERNLAGLLSRLPGSESSPQTGEMRSFDSRVRDAQNAQTAAAVTGPVAEGHQSAEKTTGGRAEGKGDLYENLRSAVRPDDLGTQMYTSGTTGEPKGVMLTHRNLATNVLNSVRWLGLGGQRDTAVTYLPLSHIFERGVWYVDMYAGIVIAYARSIDTVAQDMAEVRPTVMTSVPRMFEKMYARIIERAVSSGFPKRQITMWGLGVARKWSERRNQLKSVGPWLGLQHAIADVLVYKKIREAVGGNIRCFISGGAPLAPEIAHVFTGAGLPMLQGYGLTETSPSISCNTEKNNRIGTVGRVLDGVHLKIAPDGEILVKGDTVTQGYYNSPEKNAEAFTEDGWFQTGDIGYLDPDGYLVITDRKKDLIKTSGGKYIAPQQIESLVMSSRFVSQVVVIGDKRKFASALIYPNVELLKNYAELKGIHYSSDAELVHNPKIADLIRRQVDKYTADLARFEKIKKIALLENELTVDTGELTPTLKPRRRFIESKYKHLIDSLYEELDPASAEAEVAETHV